MAADLGNNIENQNNVPKPPRNPTIHSFAAKIGNKRTRSEVLADFFTRLCGSLAFAVIHIIWFLIWMVWNLGLVPGLRVFDPFPFGLLTMIVSLEAIFLSIFVLISQNREAKIDQLRAEVDFNINVIAEQEITKILDLLTVLMEKQGINIKEDPEIQKMLRRVDPWYIGKKIEAQLELKNK